MPARTKTRGYTGPPSLDALSLQTASWPSAWNAHDHEAHLRAYHLHLEKIASEEARRVKELQEQLKSTKAELAQQQHDTQAAMKQQQQNAAHQHEMDAAHLSLLEQQLRAAQQHMSELSEALAAKAAAAQSAVTQSLESRIAALEAQSHLQQAELDAARKELARKAKSSATTPVATKSVSEEDRPTPSALNGTTLNDAYFSSNPSSTPTAAPESQ